MSPDGESFEYYLSIEEYSTGIEIFEGYVLLDPTVTEFIFDEYGVNSLYSDMASDVIELGNEIGNYLLLDVLIYTDAFLSIANTDFGCELCSVADFGFTR